MPSIKPRINVVLEPSLFDLIRRIGEHQDKSASKVLRELIAPTEPVLREIVDALDRVASLDGDARRSAAINSSKAMLDHAKSVTADIENQMTIFDVDGVREDAPDAPTGAPAAPSADTVPTPVSNTGVTLAVPLAKKRLKS